MPTQQTTYNSRVTDEALEKKFRDTFKSQGGAELVDDLYAQGVIVPIVDFTAAAQGSELRSDLQTAWDYATDLTTVVNTTTTAISTPGFWKCGWSIENVGAAVGGINIRITDGVTPKTINSLKVNANESLYFPDAFVVFLRSGDALTVQTTNGNTFIRFHYRQIADVSGTLINPLGFTSS